MTELPNRTEPMVSVIMNAHNSARFIRDAITSVLDQTHSNWEIIVWDNASEDDSCDIVKSFQDQRIRYFYDPVKVSLYQSRMNAFAKCQGEFVAFLDCDDAWFPSKLASQVELLSQQDCVMTCANYEVVRGTSLSDGSARTSISRGYSEGILDGRRVFRDYRVGMSTLLVRRLAALEVWTENPPPFSVLEDYDMVLRLVVKGHLYASSEVLARYLVHRDNFSRNWQQTVSEWTMLITELPAMGLEADVRECAASYANQQLAILRARSALAEGERLQAVKQIARIRNLRIKMRYALGIFSPTKLVRQ